MKAVLFVLVAIINHEVSLVVARVMLHILENKAHRLVKKYIEENTSYQFSGVLGIGTYGVTYLITELTTGKHYVLKRLKTKHCHSKKIRLRFQQEIEILQQIDMKNIPSVKKAGDIYNIPYYIMDYMEGVTFEEAIFKIGNVYSLPESLHITQKLLQIISQIHKNGIVHRDLSIPNILIHRCHLYIIDFGLATTINPNEHIDEIKNPKKCKSHLSDLYFVGHFLLFLLYSSFTPTESTERCWQEELQLPLEVKDYIERLLLIQRPFRSAEEALRAIPKI